MMEIADIEERSSRYSLHKNDWKVFKISDRHQVTGTRSQGTRRKINNKKICTYIIFKFKKSKTFKEVTGKKLCDLQRDRNKNYIERLFRNCKSYAGKRMEWNI